MTFLNCGICLLKERFLSVRTKYSQVRWRRKFCANSQPRRKFCPHSQLGMTGNCILPHASLLFCFPFTSTFLSSNENTSLVILHLKTWGQVHCFVWGHQTWLQAPLTQWLLDNKKGFQEWWSCRILFLDSCQLAPAGAHWCQVFLIQVWMKTSLAGQTFSVGCIRFLPLIHMVFSIHWGLSPSISVTSLRHMHTNTHM